MEQARPVDADRLLATYLRDHFAGATAGLSLARRCQQAQAGTPLDDTLRGIEAEIDDDRQRLRTMMARLGVRPSSVKAALGSIAEVVGRLKSNGRVFRRSPSSTVVELEGLAAGVETKRNLWRSLRAVAPTRDGLDLTELDTLVERASSQLDRLLVAHEDAARAAFGAPAAQRADGAPTG
jgi:hypothetical protein